MKAAVRMLLALVLIFLCGCSLETSEDVQGVLKEAGDTFEKAKESLEDSGMIEEAKGWLEEAKESASGVLPEEVSSLLDPSSLLEYFNEDNIETILTMKDSAGVLLNTVKLGSYEEIYNEYSRKLRSMGPKLLEEYNREAAGNINGAEGLADFANAKVEKLAELEAEGTQALAVYMYAKDPSGYEAYEAWAQKLYEVYSEQADQIYSAYLSAF